MYILGSIFDLIGRISIAAIFIMAGISKVFAWDQTMLFMQNHGMTHVHFFLLAATLIEIILGFTTLIGLLTKSSTFILALYLIPVTCIFHNFWDFDGIGHGMQKIEFLKNLAIFGGLLCISSSSYTKFRLDSIRKKTNY